jgi:hypothetical protein
MKTDTKVRCDQTRVPNAAQQIADAHHAATIEAAWYGPSLAELLAKISPELATTAISEAHSISALLQHLLLWNERVRNTSDSNPMPRWEPEKEWAEPLIPWNDVFGLALQTILFRAVLHADTLKLRVRQCRRLASCSCLGAKWN